MASDWSGDECKKNQYGSCDHTIKAQPFLKCVRDKRRQGFNCTVTATILASNKDSLSHMVPSKCIGTQLQELPYLYFILNSEMKSFIPHRILGIFDGLCLHPFH